MSLIQKYFGYLLGKMTDENRKIWYEKFYYLVTGFFS